jgi:hypothetical protein
MVALAHPGSAQAAVRNVPGTYPTIAAGLAAASSGDVVLVAPGTYVISSTMNGLDDERDASGFGHRLDDHARSPPASATC